MSASLSRRHALVSGKSDQKIPRRGLLEQVRGNEHVHGGPEQIDDHEVRMTPRIHDKTEVPFPSAAIVPI